jgi:signal transduction histidine kinase/ligand-binding sensor domain-containing protein
MFSNNNFSPSIVSIFAIFVFLFYACSQNSKDNIQSINGNTLPTDLIKIGEAKVANLDWENVQWSNQIIKTNKVSDFNIENESTLISVNKASFAFDTLKKIIPDTITLKNRNKSLITSIPESNQVKEMAAKPENRSSITYFDKLQGLKQSFVTSLLNDKFGNLWFGTHGGGITRYDGRYFTHFTEKEGLAGNSVFCIRQLSDDNLWLGTYGKGISIFDGASFENISSKNGFPSDNIFSIIQDKKGKIWIGTQGGGLIMIENSNQKNIFQYNTKNGFFSDNITTLLEDKNGGIWVGSEDNGIVKFEDNTMKVPSDKKLSTLTITEIISDLKDNIWLTTYGNGLYKIEGENLIDYNEANGFPSNLLTSIKVDNSGDLWVGSDGKGVIKMNNHKSGVYEIKVINTSHGMSNDNIYSILQDDNGCMWFGTYRGGVNKYNGNYFLQFKEGIFYTITEDKNNSIWVGTSEEGIMKFVSNPSKTGWNKLSTITTANGLSNNRVLCSYTDSKDRKWFGTGDGINIIEGNTISSLNQKNELSGKKVLAIFEDKKGLFWFGFSEGEGIAAYDGKKITYFKEFRKLVKSAVFTIAEDNEGRIWFGTESDGIIIWDGINFYKFDEKLAFNKNAVFSIKKDSDGFIWIGTEGNGIYAFDGKQFYNINEHLGLSNNFVFSILEDSNQDLWIGTRFGLSILKQNKKNKLIELLKTNSITPSNEPYFLTYTYEDGFLGVGCNRNAIYQSSDQSVWIGSSDRLTVSQISKFKNLVDDKKKTLPLFISKLDLFNEKINWVDLNSKNIKSQKLDNGVNIQNLAFSSLTPWYHIPTNICLSHDNNYLTFYFTAITQDQPQKVKFQYKIDHIDKEWSAWKIDNTAHYSHLHPGTYNLKVKAMDYKGNQSEVVKYTFEIRNPWWYAWWMKILYLFALLGIIYALHINQKNKTIKNERLKSQAKALQQAKQIEKAYSELKETQQQLIQSEKMASLGELTAGIAHEIQNPLNFVNNFSEVSNELIDEMNEEFKKGDIDEGIAIANDIKQNLEKIKHHGKRASDIVKGMLEHSRKSTVEKEPTDINALCDEFLRLAYHGLRAKDKSFNANMETHFDPTLPKIAVIPQDIGRVILNLINNAFYAVNERTKKVETGYEPKVTITTQPTDDNHLLIAIKDNGSGIPEHIKDKIFQPFFTTKPTGQGTGLGLSLSYDIVKAHGGIIAVDSQEGEGTTFTIQVPTS